MITLIEYLIAIREYAKEIHYHAHGESFYGIHLLMDRVADGLYDTIDKIKEVYYLGDITDSPKASELLKVAAAYIPEVTSSNEQNIRNLGDLIAKTLDHIENEYSLDPALQNRATNAILDAISEDLKLKRGLIWKNV